MYPRQYLLLFVMICAGIGAMSRPVAKNILHGDAKGSVPFSGSQYFTDEYKYAKILLSSGRVFADVKMRLDLAEQQAFVITANGIEANMGGGMVKEITYADTTDKGIISYKFQTGFPAIDKQTKNHFYLVLTEGRCSFLKLIWKKASERRNDLFATTTRDYETFEDYYFFSKGEMKKFKKDKDFVLAELSDKQAEVNQFIIANKINVKNQEHMVKLLNYYNAL